MMSFIKMLFCALFLAGWGLAALSLHVVRTSNSVTLVTKDKLGVTDTYCDTRNWTADDQLKHPEVMSRLAQTNQTEAINPNASEARKTTRTTTRNNRDHSVKTVPVSNDKDNWWTMR